jgi:GNAT superfamily N-acetyltransferase
MEASSDIRVTTGFDPHHRPAAAELYWDAFGLKLEHSIGPRSRGVKLIERNLAPDRAVTAFHGDILVGLAGFQLEGRALTRITPRDIIGEFGLWGSPRRIAWAAILDRRPASDELMMDGIVVRADHRGHGIGTMLLMRMFDLAAEHGKRYVRLDVVDTNPAARKLYEKMGFFELEQERVPLLRRLMGIKAPTTMERPVP